MKSRVAAYAGALFLCSQNALGQAFLHAGDLKVREDIGLLVDEGVIELPLNEWPLARADVEQAIRSLDAAEFAEPAIRNALMRVQRASALRTGSEQWQIREIAVSAGQPGLLRDEATFGRENAELTSAGGATTARYNISLRATGVLGEDDGQEIRFDGSDASIRWGNWLFSANQIERWWGPGHEGSLILSSNARPMPALSLDRVQSLPSGLPVLRWLGAWRATGFLALMERHRSDVDGPLFLGTRISFKPSPMFEFGMSRTAQFCGAGRRCNLETFGRVLVGQDNVGRRGLEDPLDEPGNQMAGFDARIVSPFPALPLALYAQEIGEDNSSSGIPERYLALFGGETWFMLETGSVIRAHVEYANTKAKWYDSDLDYEVAYRQAIFTEGYRYHGRNIGHTSDGDAETASFGLSLTTGEGDRWAVLVRRGRLDRCCVPTANSLITNGPSDYKSAQVSREGGLLGMQLDVAVGYEKQRLDDAGRGTGVFGFLRLKKALSSR